MPITYPPEMLPVSDDEGAQVVVCCGADCCMAENARLRAALWKIANEDPYKDDGHHFTGMAREALIGHRSQPMKCEHDLSERETACADGMCPICLTAENERLRSQLGHCPNTSDGRHEWMMYLVGPDGQRLGPGSSPAGHGAAAVFCQYCGAPKLPVEENRVVLSDQQSTLQEK